MTIRSAAELLVLAALWGASFLFMRVAALVWPAGPVSAPAWWSVALLGILCTAVAYVLYFRRIATIGALAISVTNAFPNPHKTCQ